MASKLWIWAADFWVVVFQVAPSQNATARSWWLTETIKNISMPEEDGNLKNIGFMETMKNWTFSNIQRMSSHAKTHGFSIGALTIT